VFDRTSWLVGFVLLVPVPVLQAQPPTCTDPRLVIELVAREPEIVTPTGLAVDERGRVWVIENNTHERPGNYHGPKSDRLRVFSDFDAGGRPRHVATFAEGFRNAMSLSLAGDGAVLLATRSDIYRLRDTHGNGVADERQVIVRLDTPGRYPHNGLSGFAWDELGNLYFSLGENLGAPYKLIGSDGTTLSGGGEGGSIYRCRPDGSRLVRIATGFWNTFHLTVDAFGRLFAVDNDPDSRGPCRLLHIVPGGDYGYRYRNGRKGLHPFTAWNGELPGTLPMVAGTGEAPCGVLAYESNGLPADYRGDLLVTSWGDHLVERFRLRPRGASFAAGAQTLVRGGEDFRPVAIALAPDGSIFLSDWVDKSYPVHGKGRIWRVRARRPPADDGLRPSGVTALGPRRLEALLSDPRRDVRAAAGQALAAHGASGRAVLARVVRHLTDVRARLQALWSLTRSDLPGDAALLAECLDDTAPEVRGEAAALLGACLAPDPAERNEKRLLALAQRDPVPYVRMQALLQLRTAAGLEAVVPVLADPDPFLAGAALEALGRPGSFAMLTSRLRGADAKLRLGLLGALRRSGDPAGQMNIPHLLDDPDPGVRRAAIQWVGEERLRQYAPLLAPAAARAPVTRDVFAALLAADAFLEGRSGDPNDEPSGEEYIAKVLRDPAQPAALRALALRMLRPDHPLLTAGRLRDFLSSGAPALRREAARTLALRSDEPCQELLRGLAADATASPALRAEAVLGLANSAPGSAATRDLLLSLLSAPGLRRDALRSLRDLESRPEVRNAVLAWWDQVSGHPPTAPERQELAEQVLLAFGASRDPETVRLLKPVVEQAGPRPENGPQWREALSGAGDPAAGERVFFHPRGPRCFVCHRIDGRGGAIGPDLSRVGGSTARDKLIESILTPSKEIAPQYVSWVITTRDGRVRTGVIVDEGPNSTITMADAQGRLEVLSRADVEERHALNTSIMPENLPALMTRQEFRDLIAYLAQRR
jgi:putative membrane-bound dehydrogenase-like protein